MVYSKFDIAYYRATFNYMMYTNPGRTVESILWNVLAAVEAMVETFHDCTVDIDSSPIHDLLAFGEARKEGVLSPLVRGIQYPEKYAGGMVYSLEPACVVSVAEMGEFSGEVPQYFAVDFDCVTDEVDEEFIEHEGYIPSPRWHVSCCTVAREGIGVRLYVDVFSYDPYDGGLISDTPFSVFDDLFSYWFESPNGVQAYSGIYPAIGSAMPLDFVTMDPVETQDEADDSCVASILEEGIGTSWNGVPIRISELTGIQDVCTLVCDSSYTRWKLFRTMLFDPQRTIPITLVCSDRNGIYPIDVDDFAKRVGGMSEIFYADLSDKNVSTLLNRIFRRRGPENAFRCRPGWVRLYPCGIDLHEESDAIKCPSYRCADIEGEGMSVLDDYYALVKELVLLQPYADSEFMDVQKLVRKRAKSAFDAYVEAERNLSLVSESEAMEFRGKVADVDALVSEISAAYDLMDELGKQNDGLREDLEESRRNVAEISAARTQLFTEYRDLVDARDRHRSVIGQLRSSQQIFDAISRQLPNKVADILELIGRVFPDKVVVLKEAEKSAKRYGARNLNDAWVILCNIPTTLWQLHFVEGGDIEGKFKDRTGFDLALTETGLTKSDEATMRRTRSREYGKGFVMIVPHIKGGSPGDPFRVHYALDNDKKLIVIGHCGEHLPTSKSRH